MFFGGGELCTHVPMRSDHGAALAAVTQRGGRGEPLPTVLLAWISAAYVRYGEVSHRPPVLGGGW